MEEIQVRPVLCRCFTDIHTKFHIGESLGAGQYSTVLRGVGLVDPWKDQTVALKVYAKARRGIEHGIRMEIDVLKALHAPEPQPNIMKFLDVFEDELRVYVVMEYVGGGNLIERIAKSNMFTENTASRLIRTLVAVLQHMHSRNIIHRDVKPQNIMFTDGDDPQMKVIDFSSAYVIKKDATVSKPVGTVKYMAQEMLLKREYNELVDMWSVGVIAYTILSGMEPFVGNGFALHVAIQNGNYGFPEPQWTGITATAKDFVSQLICPVGKRMSASVALQHSWLHITEECGKLNRQVSDIKLSGSMRRCRDEVRGAALEAQNEDDKNVKGSRSTSFGFVAGTSDSAPTAVVPCAACGRHVLGGVKYGDGSYHEQCFTCVACCLPIVPISNLSTHDNFPYHRSCRQKMIAQQPVWGVGSGSLTPRLSAAVGVTSSPRPSTSPRDVAVQPSRKAAAPETHIAMPFKAKFCYECGTKYESATMKFCVNCGEMRL